MSNLDDFDIEAGDELLAGAHGGPGAPLPDDMHPLARRMIWAIDWFAEWQGRIVALFVVPIIFAMVYEVIARKFFIAPTLWAFDISRMLYGTSFMLGAAYALMKGLHIRADFLYRAFSVKTQGWVDLALYVVLFMPGMIFLLWAGYDFSLKSFLISGLFCDLVNIIYF